MDAKFPPPSVGRLLGLLLAEYTDGLLAQNGPSALTMLEPDQTRLACCLEIELKIRSTTLAGGTEKKQIQKHKTYGNLGSRQSSTCEKKNPGGHVILWVQSLGEHQQISDFLL